MSEWSRVEMLLISSRLDLIERLEWWMSLGDIIRGLVDPIDRCCRQRDHGTQLYTRVEWCPCSGGWPVNRVGDLESPPPPSVVAIRDV